MRKLKNLWKRIPRPVRAGMGTVSVLLLAVALYISIGFPSLSFEQDFRRMEKQQLLGPSKIVSRLNRSDNFEDFDDLIVGETDFGVLFFSRRGNDGYGSFNQYSYEFYYREKTGDVTVLAAPCWGGVALIGDQLPVYVFDNYPEATQADLSITVTGSKRVNLNGESTVHEFTQAFHSSSHRTTEGHFYFVLKCDKNYADPTVFSPTEAALEQLSSVCYSLFANDPEPQITATVKLYDEAGKLLAEKTMDIERIPAAHHQS